MDGGWFPWRWVCWCFDPCPTTCVWDLGVNGVTSLVLWWRFRQLESLCTGIETHTFVLLGTPVFWWDTDGLGVFGSSNFGREVMVSGVTESPLRRKGTLWPFTDKNVRSRYPLPGGLFVALVHNSHGQMVESRRRVGPGGSLPWLSVLSKESAPPDEILILRVKEFTSLT